MDINRFVLGDFATNCYVVRGPEPGRCLLIDPAGQGPQLAAWLEAQQLQPAAVLLTHGHYDHMSAAQAVAENLSVKIFASTRSQKYFESATYNLSKFFEAGALTIPEDIVTYLADGATVALADGTLALRLVPAPGHTEDGTMYVAVAKNTDGKENSMAAKNGDGTENSVVAENSTPPIAFVGDTIFRASYGATRFPGGDEATLLRSIKTQILTLPESTVLFSGHSEPTTVGEEKTQPWYQ